ncbi:MAG: sucrose-specific PTS transporter subunit IIBC [Rothia sp. (in: high G+C Gram-positive bacteria)]|uniref:sucrose-specific PTS transporter subunit IIBC n=1 Tax=Rothia sp. (in: high G+C Gram-positive bacteria) TaxID=1885016 RepID=UPI00271178CC|nr:sucrose-specific PTS transporter subunit IIBC [Rothia sp. (in: high G+C Gram-positive bacteria)]
MDHKSVAERVLTAVGGTDNIAAGAHCATRLRLVLKDMNVINQDALDNDEDLKGTFNNSGQFQIIVGPGDVDEVYKHMAAAGMKQVSKDELKNVAASQGNLFTRFIKVVSEIFLPIIPVLVGTGLLMALNNVLTAPKIFDPTKSLIELYPAWEGFAGIVNLLSAAAFAFLPVLVGFTATKVFGGNPYLGMTMGAAMVFPSLVNGYNVAAALEDGTMTYWDVFGIQVQQAGYQGTVLPVILVAFILANVEKFFHKILKGTIDFMFTPTLTLLITGFATFMLVGPPMFKLGTLLGEGINWLYTAAGPVGGFLFGLVYSPIVITGLHQSFPPIELQLLAAGGSFIFAIASMANVAQGGAALGVYLTSKDKKMKALAGATAPSAFLGITEPAIFGVNIRLRWPFYIAMGASAVASTLIALFGVKASGLGAAGFLGLPSIDPAQGMGWMGFIIAILTSAVLSTGASFIYGKRVFAGQVAEEEVEAAAPATAAASVAAPAASAPAAATEGYELTAHLNGTAVELSAVSDPTFASGALGPGAAVEPTEGKLYAPADGKVTVAFPTGHAIGMRTDKGVEVLMHIGFDTVELDGKHFTPKVERGQEVKRGDVLVEFDMAAIKAAGYPLTTPLVITNAKKTVDSTALAVAAGSTVAAGRDQLVSVAAKTATV